MAQVEIGTVDVFVIAPRSAGWRVLALQRGTDTRCPGAGSLCTATSNPERSRRTRRSAKCARSPGWSSRLYNACVQPFYLHKTHTLQLAIVFAAFVDEPDAVVIGVEHQRAEWLSVEDALLRSTFPGASVAADDR